MLLSSCWRRGRYSTPYCPPVPSFCPACVYLKLPKEGFALASPGENHGKLRTRPRVAKGTALPSCRRKHRTFTRKAQHSATRFVSLNRIQRRPPPPSPAESRTRRRGIPRPFGHRGPPAGGLRPGQGSSPPPSPAAACPLPAGGRPPRPGPLRRRPPPRPGAVSAAQRGRGSAARSGPSRAREAGPGTASRRAASLPAPEPCVRKRP